MYYHVADLIDNPKTWRNFCAISPFMQEYSDNNQERMKRKFSRKKITQFVYHPENSKAHLLPRIINTESYITKYIGPSLYKNILMGYLDNANMVNIFRHENDITVRFFVLPNGDIYGRCTFNIQYDQLIGLDYSWHRNFSYSGEIKHNAKEGEWIWGFLGDKKLKWCTEVYSKKYAHFISIWR